MYGGPTGKRCPGIALTDWRVRVYTIVLLTEKFLSPGDVEMVTSLHEGVETRFVVLMPERADHHRVVQALDDVALGHGERAADALTTSPDELDEKEPTGLTLSASVQALRDAGANAEADEAPGEDPLDYLKEAVAKHTADEVIVLTDPHLIEETFHRDWASRARHEVGVPVLKLYAHSA
jgi:hypothetical protein